ncbi:ComEC/Rec2 family competence protein [Hirschia litorea]|uniref:ComEC/Rec2 family competence protein n=1 Tax=Hirschia litorea TaxID=1199156 RepID=A0ABW2IHA9_9PROT
MALAGAVLFVRLDFFRSNFVLNLTAICLVFFALGFNLIKLRTFCVDKPMIHSSMGPVTLEGKLIQIEGGNNGNRLRIQVGAVSGLPLADTPKFVRVTQRNNTQLSPGRLLRCLVFLSPPPKQILDTDYNFRRQAFFQQLGGVGFVLGECKPIGVVNLKQPNAFEQLQDKIAASRHAIALHIYKVIGPQAGGMAAAMITGERSLLTSREQELLRSVGLAHLLAISGLHMGLAAGVFFFLIRTSIPYFEWITLRVPVQKVAAFGAILGATTYLVMSGASVATQRAYIMALIALVAILFDRPAFSLRSVLVAMFIVLILQPETVVTPGFQMSFAATAALIAMYENWPRNKSSGKWGKLSNWISSLVATSVTASLATAPFAAFHFGRIAPLSIPANLMVMPIISLLSAPVASLALLAWPLGIQDPFLVAFGASLNKVLEISQFVSQISVDGSVTLVTPLIFGCLVLGIGLSIVFDSWFKTLAIIPIIIALGFAYFQKAPIAHVDEQGIIYLAQGNRWVRILPQGMRKKPLAPLSIKDKLEEGNIESYLNPVWIDNPEYNVSVNQELCTPRFLENENIDDFSYLRLSRGNSNICLPVGRTEQASRFTVLSRGNTLSVRYWGGGHQKRPWSD